MTLAENPVIPLKRLAAVMTSNVDKHSVEGEQQVSLCNYVDVYKNERITDALDFMGATATEAQIARFTLQAHDVIVTKDSEEPTDIGIPAYVPSSLPGVVCGYHLAVLRPSDDRLYGGYLHWALQSAEVQAYYSTAATGISRYALGIGDLGMTPIHVPSRTEQERIANFLDEQTARIDALIAEKERLDGRLQEYRSSLISAAVTGQIGVEGVNDAGEAVCGADEGGVGMTLNQDVRRLKYAVEACVNGVWGDEPNGEDDMVVVRVADFDRTKGVATLGDSPTMRAIPESARNRRVLRPGDLLIEKSGGGEQQPVGNVVLFTDDRPAVCSNFVARMPVVANCDSRFVAYVFRALYTDAKNVPHIKQTSGIQNLDSESYLNETAWLPARVDQERIANFLDEQTTRIDALRHHVHTHIARLREYRSSLISAAVTGQLDLSTFKASA